MPRYYTRRSEAELAPGQKWNFRRGRGYYIVDASGKHVDALDPATARAQAAVEASLAPVIQAIERQRQRDRDYWGQQQQGLQQWYQSAAGEAGKIAPAITSSYAEGAQNTAAFGKGYSDGLRMLQGDSAQQANADLAKQGAPEGAMLNPNPTAASDVLYALGGAIPAETLEREGRAFGAAAQQLPLTTLGYGADAIKELLQQASEVDAQYADQLAEIQAKRPGLVQAALDEFRQMEQAEREQWLKERAFEFETGLKLRKQDFDEAARTESLAQGRDRIAIQQYNSNLRRIQNDRSYQLGLDRLGIQEEGLRLRAAELEARKKTKNKKKGYTPKQMADLRGIAGTIARNSYKGFTDEDDNKYPPVSYQEAVRIGLDEGVPLSILLPALNRYYKRGERGRPKLDFYQRRNARKAARAKPNRG